MTPSDQKGPRFDSILGIDLPYRERLELRRTLFGDGSGPRVAVTSGIHGDEMEGLYVCHLLSRWLEDLLATNPDALKGTVELYPTINSLGLDTLTRAVPVYDADLNRHFPGNAKGQLPKRVAAALMESLAGAALVVDIHASNIYLREIPQVRINNDFADTLIPLAHGMNLNLIWVHGAVTVLEATIAHSLNSIDVPCLVVEMGVGMRIDTHYADQLVTGILSVWRSLGVFDPDLALPPLTHKPMLADDTNVHYLNADHSGFFVPDIDHWMTVRKDELLGRIVSPHHGQVLAEVRSPCDGVLFTLREYPLVYEGSLMARIFEADVFLEEAP